MLGLELRLESEENAKNLDQISNIFVDLGIEVENSFPEDFYKKNAEMIVYEIIGDDSSISKKGHQEYKALDSGIKLLTVGTYENQNPFSKSIVDYGTMNSQKSKSKSIFHSGF